MKKKYVLSDNFIIDDYGKKLYRIKCVQSFKYAKEGDWGGYVENEENLDQSGNAWVSDNARVYNKARIYGDAYVFDNAVVSKNAMIYDNAKVYGNAEVFDASEVYDDSQIYENAQVFGNASVFDNACIHGYAEISDSVWIGGFSDIYGYTDICGYARIYNNAYIGSNSEHCGFDCFGAQNRHIHAYLTKKRKVEITYGYFFGGIAEFEKEFKEDPINNAYIKEYEAVINAIKVKFKL